MHRDILLATNDITRKDFKLSKIKTREMLEWKR